MLSPHFFTVYFVVSCRYSLPNSPYLPQIPLHVDPSCEDGGSKVLRNVSILYHDTVSQPRRPRAARIHLILDCSPSFCGTFNCCFMETANEPYHEYKTQFYTLTKRNTEVAPDKFQGINTT
jgi:hypothetical protein